MTEQFDSIYFTRELEQILPGIYKKRDAPLSGERLFPIIALADCQHEFYTLRGVDTRGRAHRGSISERGCKSDVPVVNMDMSEEAHRIHKHKIGWEMTYCERDRSNRLNKGVAERYARAALRELMRFENDILFNGDALTGQAGLLTPGFLADEVLPNGQWNDPARTAAEIYADLEFMALCIERKTDCVYDDAVNLVLPCAAWNIANGTQFSPGTDTTVLQYFQRNWSSKIAGIEKAREMDAANVALAYVRGEDNMGHIRMPARQLMKDDSFCEKIKVHYEMGTSGLIVVDDNTQCKFLNILLP